MKKSATLSADGLTVTHRGGSWSITFPVADLPRWLEFYRGLRDRLAPRDRNGKVTGSGPYAAFYEADVAALERVQKMAKVMGTG